MGAKVDIARRDFKLKKWLKIYNFEIGDRRKDNDYSICDYDDPDNFNALSPLSEMEYTTTAMHEKFEFTPLFLLLLLILQNTNEIYETKGKTVG